MEKDQEANPVSSAGSPEKFSRGTAGLLRVSKGVLLPWSRTSGTGDKGLRGYDEWQGTEVATMLLSPCQGYSSTVDSSL